MNQTSWRGLDAFYGDLVLAIWKEKVQLFGVQFGGRIGYHLVKVIDCLCLDWCLWPNKHVSEWGRRDLENIPSPDHDNISSEALLPLGSPH